MAQGAPGSPRPAESATDPTTVVGLIFRVLNRPSRTLCLLAILALVLAGIGALVHAPAIADLPVGVCAAVVSGASVSWLGVGKLVCYLRGGMQDQPSDVTGGKTGEGSTAP